MTLSREFSELTYEERALVLRVCGDKRRHPTRKAAHRHAMHLLHRKGDNVHPYKCMVCDHWHVGHTPSMRTLEQIARLIRGLPLHGLPHDHSDRPGHTESESA